jgi:hypothetical protein
VGDGEDLFGCGWRREVLFFGVWHDDAAEYHFGELGQEDRVSMFECY